MAVAISVVTVVRAIVTSFAFAIWRRWPRQQRCCYKLISNNLECHGRTPALTKFI